MMTLASIPAVTPSATYYAIHRAGRYWDVVLVTPTGSNPIKTRLRRWADRESAFADAAVTSGLTGTPFKLPRAA